MNTIKRHAHQVLATTYYPLKTSRVLASILIGLGILISILSYTKPELSPEGNPAYIPFIVGIVFTGAGTAFLIPYPIFKARLRHPHTYNPASRGRKHIISQIFALSFISLFFSVFLSLPKVQSEKKLLYVLIGMAIIFFCAYAYQIFKGIMLILNSRKFGPSYLTSKPSYSLGERIQGVFKNERLAQDAPNLELVLRNLREHPAFSKPAKNKSNNGFQTEVLYEKSQQISLTGNSFEFGLTLPESGELTHYLAYNPTYWELEISDTDCGFYSRFLIHVND